MREMRASFALLVALFWFVSVPAFLAQSVMPGAQSAKAVLSGTVTAGTARLPGVAITVTPAGGGTPLVTSTQLDGTYQVELPGPGQYQVLAELAAFAPVTLTVTVGPEGRAHQDVTMTLASRTAGAAPVEARPVVVPAPRQPAAAQFQRLAPVADRAGVGQIQTQAGAAGAGEDLQTVAAHLSLPPGFSPESLSETVAAFGSTGQTNTALLFGGFREGMGLGMMGISDIMAAAGRGGQLGFDLPELVQAGLGGLGMPGMPGQGPGGGRGGEFGGGLGGRGGMEGGPGTGGRGGMGGPPGGPEGRGGLAGRLAMAGQAMNNRPRGQVAYTLGGSPFDASPFSLTGQPVSKPQYLQQRVAASIGGPLRIPKVFDAGQRTSFFLNYSGNHSSNFYSAYSTVPTLAARSGDLSAVAAPIIDPLTGQPFPGNQIPADRLNAAALALLRLYPEPNLPGDRQNYYRSTTNRTSSDDINFRLTRTFGTTNRRPGRGGAAAAVGGRGGRGGMMGGGINLSIAVNYQRSESAQNNPFPTITGKTHRTGWNVPFSFGFPAFGLIHSVNVQFNRSSAQTRNAFAYAQNLTGEAGILGVSTDPFDWGTPTLSFSSISGLRDINPSQSRDQTVTINYSSTKMRGRHAIRFGGNFRDQRLESWTNSNARGSFVFTGLYAGQGKRVSGLDFADFLLGLPQQASVQYGPGRVRYQAQSVNLYVQDDWRVRSNFTINAGLRYEYQSPYAEENNRLVTLDVPPDFSAAVPVIAGSTGPFSGTFVRTIVKPDRNNLAPRVGLAWRPMAKTIVRGGYGINYASVPYMSFAQRLASQPPFAVTDTRIGTLERPLLLTDAFGTPIVDVTTNTFGVDPNYQIGYVHIWNADVQRDLTRTISMGVAYTGTKGSQLDIQRAPNRGPTGLRIEGVQPFIWESSEGRSIMHALSIRVNRRMAQGISGGATYTLSKSMDNASSIGGGAGVVAQNDQDLEAEWGRSSFDQRHRLTANFTWELPFGPNRRWLSGGGVPGVLFGGWILNGTFSMSSGTPYTARVVGDSADVSRGTNGTLRADYLGGKISLDHPTIERFFNTSVFAVPAPGTFGNAARNTIDGPSSYTLNMSVMKNFSFPGTRGLSVRVQATNVLNTPQWGTIDTVVNSPTFGRVTSVRGSRSVQFIARVMF